MAPTETMNLVIAPDLAQEELPFLEHMGFKQTFTPLPPLHRIKRPVGHTASPLPEARTLDETSSGDDASVASSRRASRSTAHSGGSSSAHLPLQPTGVHRAKTGKLHVPGAPTARTASATDQEVQASRLTSFISRMKYLSDEGENHEFTSGIFQAGASLAGQRSMVQAQAARVRNQLELKFQAIPYFMELDKYLEYSNSRDAAAYNPLQIIRDRKIRPHTHKEKYGRQGQQQQIMWQIPVPEMVSDMRWRYQCTKIKAQKLKRREKKAQCAAAAEQRESPVKPQQDASAEDLPMPLAIPTHEHGSAHHHRRQHTPPQFNNPFLTPKSRRHSQASEGPTLLLPETGCGELIERLRSSHGAPDNVSLDGGANSSSSESGRSSFHDTSEIDPLSHQPSSFRRQFCRNTASINDTRNRLRSSQDHPEPFRTGSSGQTDDDLLKPLSRSQTGHSQSLSVDSRSSSIPEIFQFDAGSASSVSLAFNDQATMSAHSASVASAASAPKLAPKVAAPVVTVTSDAGDQKLLDQLKRTPRATNLGNLGNLRQASGESTYKSPASFSLTEDTMNDLNDICTFGSIRPGHADVRKSQWERAAHSAEEDLEYNILLFKVALRRENLERVRNRVARKYVPQDLCDEVSQQLKNEGVPHFLNYLNGVEQVVVNRQQILDADFASSLDALRVSTDRMVSEVNTTLNKQVREMSSRMEKITTARNCGFCTNASYTLLEYVVLSLMWVIWCVVKMWRFALGGFNVLRGGCNMFIIA